MTIHSRWRYGLIVILLIVGSAWWLNRMSDDPSNRLTVESLPGPDYIMTQFTDTRIAADGTVRNRLHAAYMEHFKDADRTELHEPVYELFRDQREPVYVTAERGWVTDNSTVILLRGDVRFREVSAQGEPGFEIRTSEAYLYPEIDYAETGEPATLNANDTTTRGIGLRVFLEQERMEFLQQVHTRIEPRRREQP